MKIHLCLLDRECWQHWWWYGMPMRLYVSFRKSRRGFYVPVWPLNTWRHNKVWKDAEPVEIVRGPNG